MVLITRPFIALITLVLLAPAPAQRQMETLTRGLVAVPDGTGAVLVSWRLFGTDPQAITFNLYQQSPGEAPIKLNPEPIASATSFPVGENQLKPAATNFVRPIIGGEEGAASAAAAPWQHGYLEIPIQTIPGYRPGDASAADLDGDGDYEIIVHQGGRARDNSHAGLTDEPVLDAYRLDGTHLWRINLGKNIRDGEHYTQFIVYDLDGDGRAELACKTADGSRDGRGAVIGDPGKDWRTPDESSQAFGRVLDGPEFLTIFDGLTGAALKTVDYIPGRDPIDGVEPSGNSVSACNLVYLGKTLGKPEYLERAKRTIHAAALLLQQAPGAVPRMCVAYQAWLEATAP